MTNLEHLPPNPEPRKLFPKNPIRVERNFILPQNIEGTVQNIEGTVDRLTLALSDHELYEKY